VISEVEHFKVSGSEMADHLGLPPSTLSKIMVSEEKTTKTEFKFWAQVKKLRNMNLRPYNELKKDSTGMVPTGALRQCSH
jgi:hypothetical protein